ncbi:P-loop containing nucleoside triphosphate hydrolase protein [Lindgomyces ingoldianus]|uniref:P-loop containing nucleoside triphosphate hydrolase protein n=1 Tax=Lindgomyces ingoldianus TaxID=673940 RepID=A0ACB6QZ59_9PLEO|nr:P-loop containing nucleoside triphosphate hydrolase protein [Lindgomyces ingoldianus]KAF2472329.1 P-loop containing nucleoside triphosphate hydrolase protein [Lindgomyces ingoldianus]
MGSTARTSARKGTLRASEAIAHPSSRSTVADETMNVVKARGQCGTPAGTQSITNRSDVSRLSESLGSLNQGTGDGLHGASSETIGCEIEPLGEGVKDLMTTMSELEKLGLSSLDIPLAKCIICGDQSAGKSSVIEAISGIKVPRAGGTCTRCPMFIQLQSSAGAEAQWEAKVYIRKAYTYLIPKIINPRLREQARQERYYPWQQKFSPDEVLFAQTTNSDNLEVLIYRAQLAILNPTADLTRFVPGTAREILSDDRETEFSPNVVCVYISAPKAPNLSFYDLPGIIIGRGDPGKEGLKNFVRNLVAEYIADPNALILLTSSLEVDWEVSSYAASLVTKTGATQRCVGVLTKPDRIDNDSRHKDVKKALDGEADVLGHGYYVVKQPSQEALEKKITHSEARREEEMFFDQTDPWATNLHTHRERFGTLNLQTALSKKLAALSLQALPKSRAVISEQLETVEQGLARIPKPQTRDVVGLVHEALRSFTENIRKEMLRDYARNAWRLTWDQLRKDFAKKLNDLRPRMVLSAALDSEVLKPKRPECIDLCESDDDDTTSRALALPVTPQKRKLDHASTPSRGIPSKPQANGSNPSPGSANGAAPAVEKQKHAMKKFAIRYNLNETRDRLYEMSSAKLHRQVNPKAVEFLMLQSLHNWEVILQSFLKSLHERLSKRIQSILDESLTPWNSTELFKGSAEVVKKFLATHFDLLRTSIAQEILVAEKEGPYLFDQRYFDFHMSRYLEEYKNARIRARQDKYFELLEAQTGKELSKTDQENQGKKEPLRALLAQDPYSQEVEVLAQVRAYYELASIRFHESICMRVEAQLFRRLSKDLFEHLKNDLDITGEDVHERCVQLLADDPKREARRQELEQNKATLLAGRQCLNLLYEKYADASPLNLSNGINMNGDGVGANGDSVGANGDVDYDMLYE